MNKLIKTQLLLLVIGIGTIADYLMISVGLAIIFHTEGAGGAISCYIGGLICVILTATTDTLWQHRRNPTYYLLVPLLGVAFVTSAAASISYVGIYVLGGQDYGIDISKGILWWEGWEKANIFASVGMGVVIFYALISPIYITFLIREQLIERRMRLSNPEDEDSEK